jgi:tetratricopeptide (TPR) repeat protein
MSTYLPYTKFKKLSLVLVISVCFLFLETIHGQNYTLDEGKRLFDEAKYEEAKEILLEVAEQQPENPEVNFLLCKVYLFLNDHDNSIEYGKKAVKLNDSESNYHLWLGRAHGTQAQKGSKLKAIFRAKRAKEEFEKAVELDSTNLTARLDLMQYYVTAPGIAGGDKKKAKEQAEILQTLDSLYGAYAWGLFWEGEKDLDKAETYLRKAMEFDTSSNYIATYQLGFFLQRQEKYHQAAEVFDNLYNQHPDQTGALYQIGRMYVFAEDSLDKAERCFKQYLQIEPKKDTPDWAAAHWRLGMVYDLQGKTDLAVAEIEEALKLNPKNKDYEKTLKELKKKK